MKILFYLLLCGALLTGCGKRMAVETVEDQVLPQDQPAKQVLVELPGEAAVPVMEDGSSRYYICDDYEIFLDTYPAGDLGATVEKLSGFQPEDLTVVKTEREGVKRYDFVWASEGEDGQRLGRAAILDDGGHHYTLSVVRDAEREKKSQVVWRTVFESFRLE